MSRLAADTPSNIDEEGADEVEAGVDGEPELNSYGDGSDVSMSGWCFDVEFSVLLVSLMGAGLRSIFALRGADCGGSKGSGDGL